MDQPTAPPTPTAEAPTLADVARWMVIAACAFFLIRELGDILKPVFLAVLVAYVVLPVHLWVKSHVPGRASIVASIALSLAALCVVTAVVQTSARTLAGEVPELAARTQAEFLQWQAYMAEHYPVTWRTVSEFAFPERAGQGPIGDLTGRLVSSAADAMSTGAIVGLYLLFLLMEAGRFPARVHKAFSEARAGRVMDTIAGINRGIATYLTAKVKASFLLAFPVWVVLFVFQTRYALMWSVVTFFCNFVPYLGSVVGYTLPVLFALYQFEAGWEAVTIAVLLLAVHLTIASVVEPRVIGKALGVSPVVILFALAFWGYAWGLTGMLLAVPLTVMLKIVFEHMDATRPLAKLVSDE
jgi:AI-2 transport protein TqsA